MNISASECRWMRATLLFLLITSLLRLIPLACLELAPDEAYYWDWSRQLAWGYYDQGPLIAYVIRLTTMLFGTNAFGVRFGVWAASLGTLGCGYILARRVFSPLAGFLTVVALGVTPLMAVGSLVATYDPLLVFCWALALVFLERALFGETIGKRAGETPSRESRAWIGAGLATGLGFLSKHTMVLILPCLLLFLSLSLPHRKWLRRPEPYAAFALALLLYSGVFWWNAHHHWWTFGHLLFLAHKSTHSPLSRLGEFVGSQALLLGPGLFLACLYAGLTIVDCRLSIFRNARRLPVLNAQRSTLNAQHLFLFCLGLPVFLFFCLLAFRAKVQANWAPCAWITPTVLWAGWMAARLEEKAEDRRQKTADRRGNSPQTTLLAVLGISLLLTLLVMTPGLRQAVGIRLKPQDDVTTQMHGWQTLAAYVQQVRREMGQNGRKVFLAGNGYQYCTLMAFYLPDHPATYDMYLHYRLTMYAAHVERLKAHLGEDAIFLNDGEADDHDLHAIFERVEWDPPFPIWRRPLNAAPIRFVHIARCYGYRRYTGIEWAVGG